MHPVCSFVRRDVFVIEGKAAGYRRCEYAAMYRKKALPRAYRWGKGRAD